MQDALDTSVIAAMQRAAERFILPRFGNLQSGHIQEKSKGETVTIADHESEHYLTEELSRLIPGSMVVGEEAVSADSSILERMAHETCWLIDPLDGTSNFANGRKPFAVMVALLDHGEARGGWILDPITKRLCRARLHQGAWINDARIYARPSGQEPPVAALATGFLPKEMRADIETRSQDTLAHAAIPRCAGEQYPRLVTGENDLALFWRTLPWDHAPGALFLKEAGGHIARFDGSDYKPAQTGQSLLAAASPALWEAGHKILIA